MKNENKKQNKKVFPICFKYVVYLLAGVSVLGFLLIMFHSINGYIDLKGIKNTSDDYFSWRVMYIVNIVFSFTLMGCSVLISSNFKYLQKNISNNKFKDVDVHILHDFGFTQLLALFSCVFGIANALTYGYGKSS